MDELITWLRAQLDDDEQAARAAAHEWSEGGSHPWPKKWEEYELSGKLEDAGWYPQPAGFDAHWQRHSPARVLAEVDAKRRILDLDEDQSNDDYDRWPDGYEAAKESVLRLLALPYTDRPGYRDEWRP